MSTICYPVLKGRRLRLTRLDGCGRPVYGPDSVIVTKGFISVALTAVINEGDAVQVTLADGTDLVNDPAVPSLGGYGAVITLAQVEPDAVSVGTGQEVYQDYQGDTVGFTVNTGISPIDTAFALELWLGSPSANCDEGAQGSYGYLLLPFVQGGVLGDFTVENAAVSFVISNAASKDGSTWGVGPYKVVLDDATPAVLPTALDSKDHLLLIQTGVAPPEPYCGARPLLDPSSPVVTSTTATIDHLQATIAAVPSNAAPFWSDFGDGTWDYAPVGTTPLVHTYAVPGTYHVTTYRGGAAVTVNAVAVA
jgi:hypothetical protein